jgi:hypothetical protein
MLTLLLLLTAPAFAVRMPLGAPCNITNSHLDANSKQFVSDCDAFGCKSSDMGEADDSLLRDWNLPTKDLQVTLPSSFPSLWEIRLIG